ncbi:DUF192 domain-containing protein [Caldimonas sp.]|uniref:DUF192 domain-containing protein n=1 Tax=Caldimonas sp. TaxID=2838790 RepID=UPI00391A2787
MIQIKLPALQAHPVPAWRRFAAGLVGLALAATAWAQEAGQKLPSVPLRAGFHAISAEVARTPEQRAIGLMHRKEMAPHEGMLFVFETPAVQCFWMKNTLIPLSIAFLADDGRIVNIADMQPQTLDSHCSDEPVRLALEMNQGWFARRGIKPGMRIQGGPIAPPAR